jgi:RNA polymerase sigma-70 factor (ECF subfamily)
MSSMTVACDHTSCGVERELEERLEDHRAELIGYCWRMLRSPVEAEDAVQETMVRAWRGYDRFEGRSALRTWLYRIATNVCLDLRGSRGRRADPIDLGPGAAAEASPDSPWAARPAGLLDPERADPADVAVSHDEVRRALDAALRRLPPRQRAVLILREVVRWRAREVADLLGVTVVSVNSALQRARATLAARPVDDTVCRSQLGDAERELLARIADAFARNDVGALIAIVHDDVTRNAA